MKAFLNSVPKSGTFILTALAQAVGLSPGPRSLTRKVAVEHGDIPVGIGSPAMASESAVRQTLDAIPPRGFIHGHLPYSEGAHRLLVESGIQSILILRDPRDVLTSLLSYILSQPDNFLHSAFAASTADERVGMILEGTKRSPGLLSLNAQYGSVEGWLDAVTCRTVTFESLIGPRGGGTRERQTRAISDLLAHIGMGHSDPEGLADKLFSPLSPTFRRGRIGSWRDEIPPSLHLMMEERLSTAMRVYRRAAEGAP